MHACYVALADIPVDDDGEYTCQVVDASGPVAGVTHFLTVPGMYSSTRRVSIKTNTNHRFSSQFMLFS